MKLDLFKDIERKKKTKVSEKYLLLKSNEMLEEQRKILENWTEGFVDRDNKIVDEFQKNFHSSFWEFYLYAVFKELGFEMDMSKEMPDFIITDPMRINIEAVIPNISRDGRPESDRKLEETLGGMHPIFEQENFEEIIKEAIIRQSSSISSKNEKYFKTYKSKEWFKDDIPFVLALGSFDQVNYGREYVYPMVALLYQFYYEKGTGNFVRREKVKKINGAEIDLGIFNDKSNEHISAILYSCTLTIGKLTALAKSSGIIGYHNQNRVLNVRADADWPHYKIQEVEEANPEELVDGLFLFHNPNAKTKLPLSIFENSGIVQAHIVDGIIRYESSNLPLVARVNSSSIFLGSDPRSVIFSMFSNYNKDVDFDNEDEILEKLKDNESMA